MLFSQVTWAWMPLASLTQKRLNLLAGKPGSEGGPGIDDGIGSEARFNTPSGVAVDSSGNIYVADYSNHTIRKITASGVVTTFAGTAGVVGSTNGTGSAARFKYPNDVTTPDAVIFRIVWLL